MFYQLESTVPAPERAAQPLPLSTMTKGESFLIPWKEWRLSSRERQLTQVASRVYYYAKMNDKRFSVGKEYNGVRIWRIA